MFEQGKPTNVEEGRSQPYTKNYSQLRKAESQRNSQPHGRAQQLVTQYLMVSPEKTPTYVVTLDT